MKFAAPEVFCLAETKLNLNSCGEFLQHVGAPSDYLDQRGDGAATLVEMAGRVCYRSWKPGLNPNVTKIRENQTAYLKNVIQSKHGSVLEHASATFAFCDVTRVLTHELVRHRVGTAFSQESLRYVRLDEISFMIPEVFSEASLLKLADSLEMDEPRRSWTQGVYVQLMEDLRFVVKVLEDNQRKMADLLLLGECQDFDLKKKFTSALRRLAPIGLQTNIVFTANHRTLRHLIQLRTNEHAEEEIRKIFWDVWEHCVRRWPSLYFDGRADAHLGTVTFAAEKI